MDCLQTWSKRTVGSVNNRIEKLRKKLKKLNLRNFDNEQETRRNIEKELDKLLEQEEVYWKQRSRINWLKEGDRNTKFFHRKATWRSKKNKIEKLQQDNGSVIVDKEQMKEMTNQFFKDLYTADPGVQPEAILEDMVPQISEEINEKLCADFSNEEIGTALFQIGPLKAPGRDGFPARFFQRHWGVFKEDITEAVKEFFRTKRMPEGINDTVIVMIPKKKNPDIIAPNQSAFVPGRMITDNALIAFECIHSLQKSNDRKGFEEKYLGLPVPEGRMKDGKFQPVKEKLKKKFSDYAEKYASSGAKDVLIKSVIQAIPTYPMSVFKFSEGLCEDLMKLTRDFWWGDEKERRRMHWMSWDKITKRKGQGGMGFKDLHLFNQALLAKQAWRLIAFPDSLCAKLLKAKYYPNGELMDTAFIQNPSPGWQGIMHGLELLKKGAIWRIGNGAKVRIWRDNWVPRGNMKISANVNNSRLRRVSQLINNHDHTWKEDVIRDIFMPHDADAVLRIRLPSYDDEDFISWTLENHGMFTVRSAYNLALDLKNGTPPNSSSCQNGDRNLWKVIWSTNVPPKVNRARRLPNILPMCTICGMEEETGYHATMVCTKAIALRQGLEKSWNLPPESKLIHTGPDWVLVLLDSLTHDQRSIAAGHIVADRKGKGTISQGNVHRQGPILKENNENNTWMKPEEGWIKCNVDASFLSEGKAAVQEKQLF
ncbi:uncharacterized protein [Lolium perenne]|uniref:uncharacterized protein n=1 Tax=Lolium perenne TaxID=4522 RepID=UPI003A99E930